MASDKTETLMGDWFGADPRTLVPCAVHDCPSLTVAPGAEGMAFINSKGEEGWICTRCAAERSARIAADPAFC